MKKIASIVSSVLVVAGVGLTMGSGTASADAHCHPVRARITDAVAPEGCMSPVGLCTAGTVSGGPLEGTIAATVQAVAPGATPGTLSLDAVDTITTRNGSITFHFSGLFDPINGLVTFFGQSPTGTGRFAGATGTIYVNGAAASAGTFDSDVSGEICLADD
jgi:hypothetical protein